MATETATPETVEPPKKAHKIGRVTIGANVLAQIALVTAIIVMVNYVAFRWFQRWDFSRNQKYALSDQTRRLLKSLKKPVKAVVFFSPASFSPEVQIYPDVENLLKEYQYASNKRMEVEFVNPARDLTRAKDLQAQYKFGASENIVILDHDGRTKVVNAADMAEFDQGNMMYGQPPKLRAFKGEQALTSALLEIVEEKQNKIYLVTGHGEPDLKQGAVSGFKTYVERQNIKLDSFSLLNVDVIPADAGAIILIGPKYDLSEREMTLLREFWDKKGRLVIALDPNASTPRLTAWLNELGIRPQNDRLLRTMNLGPITGIVRDVVGVFEQTPITKRLRDADIQFLGHTQSLAAEAPGATQSNTRVDPLIRAAEGFWGETEYSNVQSTGVFFDPQKDHAAPLNLAVSVEKGALSDSRVQVDSSRLVVIGNATFLTNEALTEPGVDFALATLNWLINREDLIAIAPKEQKTFTLNLTEEQVRNVALIVMGAIPGFIALVGVGNHLSRRR